MGQQVIRQRDGLYAIFSNNTDTWVLYDATREEVIDEFVQEAAENARRQAERVLEKVDRDPREVYFQFTLSFAEANDISIEHEGVDLADRAP